MKREQLAQAGVDGGAIGGRKEVPRGVVSHLVAERFGVEEPVAGLGQDVRVDPHMSGAGIGDFVFEGTHEATVYVRRTRAMRYSARLSRSAAVGAGQIGPLAVIRICI